MTVFILFSQQRSGTGALTSFISNHPRIQNLTEILNPHSIEHEDNFFRFWSQNDPAEMIRTQRSPSDLFIEYLADKEKKYAGSDILLDIKLNSIRHVVNYWEELPGFSDVRMPWLINLFHRRQYPIVYLHRENHFQRYVSSKVAELTGVYHTHDPRDVGHARVEIDPESMMEYIFKGEYSHAYFEPFLEKFEKNLYLNYNELFHTNKIRPEAKTAVANFFNFEPSPDSEPYYVKLGSRKLDKVVMNYPEVCAALRLAGRAHYIDS